MQRCPGATLCVLVFASGAGCCLVSLLLGYLSRIFLDQTSETSWILRFTFTLVGYATVFLPFYVLIHFARKNNLASLSGFQWKLVRLLLTGNTSITSDQEQLVENDDDDKSGSSTKPALSKIQTLVFCCAGLQISYLTWSYLQERIMTKEYQDAGKSEMFRDSQFLVFVNRILAFAFSGVYLLVTHQRVHRTPLYKYSFCSVSNTLSSWCQYEALKFVSFPTQVLAKSAKVIPVMVMGKLVSRAQYKNYEYATAVLISAGMTAFLLGSSDENKKSSGVTTFSGAVLLCGYLIFDSFTANWQSALFKEHRPSSVQMMCGVNLMSCLFTSASLIQQGGFFYSLSFAARHPEFIVHCLLTAVCSAAGQLFIFSTIANFGAVVFTIIMTVRQGLSILLSCVFFRHHITAFGVVGVMIVFVAIFVRIYYGHRDRQRKVNLAASASVNKV
uniref:Adenosine 3'-phospho 5'-phosphosulfate transporter 1 n=1 Tax=Alona affinis TaxID=381656 RepID=A0A9N6WRY7_9CRUS|nr:EOG090X05CU [Alona affinis]